jgi:hypothetical protein
MSSSRFQRSVNSLLASHLTRLRYSIDLLDSISHQFDGEGLSDVSLAVVGQPLPLDRIFK